MTPLPLDRVKIVDSFWRRWQEVVRDTTLEIEFEQCRSTGRLENFARTARGERGTFQGIYYNDSDVYKWIEAASSTLSALDHDPGLRARLDEVVELVASAQMEDGYLNTYFQLEHPDERWTCLSAMHEMYCAGHLMEAAVAHRAATGTCVLLDCAARFGDHILSLFGPGKRRGYCGHEEIEIGLTALGRATHRQEFIDLAAWMIEERGKPDSPFAREVEDEGRLALAPWLPKLFKKNAAYDGSYAQDHLPLSEQSEVVGHAVRAMYLYSAAAQCTDDPSIMAALDRLWVNLTERRMYITGGIGSNASNEGFSKDYDLPNRNAYAETCAACGLVFWARRMLERTGESHYADIMECALYNGVLAGISFDGTRFFYDNPLSSLGDHHRMPWFDCACCPPNVARLIASLGAYAVGTSESALFIHLPIGCRLQTTFATVPVEVSIEGNYPWSGEFLIGIHPERPVEFELCIRIPGWCDDYAIRVSDAIGQFQYEEGYARLSRTWTAGDEVKVEMQMQPKWNYAHPLVVDNAGRTALSRGPLVYCLEECDLGRKVWNFAANAGSAPVETEEPELLGGIMTLMVQGTIDEASSGELYSEDRHETVPCEARFVPYWAWDNREPGSMEVWVRTMSTMSGEA